MNANLTYIHGVFLKIFGCGILLRGKSGIGKSEIALELISCGHQLIADDIVTFTRKHDALIVGTSEKLLKNFISIRNLGILNVKKLFGKRAVKKKHKLDLIIDLVEGSSEMLNTNPIYGTYHADNILALDVNVISININPFRHTALLIETTVKNLKLQQKGFDAKNEFIRHHRKFKNKKGHLCA